MITLYTAGYQGHSIETFLAMLHDAGIAHVIDVRQLPFSRKPDFSKKRFQQHLADAGIGYTHIVQLGTPKPLRDDVRRTHDYTTFFTQIQTYIAAQPEALQQALDLVMAQPSLLLCFEADIMTCHRLTVAEALQNLKQELKIVHLPT